MKKMENLFTCSIVSTSSDLDQFQELESILPNFFSSLKHNLSIVHYKAWLFSSRYIFFIRYKLTSLTEKNPKTKFCRIDSWRTIGKKWDWQRSAQKVFLWTTKLPYRKLAADSKRKLKIKHSKHFVEIIPKSWNYIFIIMNEYYGKIM